MPVGIRWDHRRDVLSPFLEQRLSHLYYTSIRQQERNFLRQLMFCVRDLRAVSLLPTCLHTYSSCCQIQVCPMVCEDKDRKKPGKSYQKRLKFIIFGNYIHIYTYKRTFHVNIYINTKNEIVQIREGSARFLF